MSAGPVVPPWQPSRMASPSSPPRPPTAGDRGLGRCVRSAAGESWRGRSRHATNLGGSCRAGFHGIWFTAGVTPVAAVNSSTWSRAWLLTPTARTLPASRATRNASHAGTCPRPVGGECTSNRSTKSRPSARKPASSTSLSRPTSSGRSFVVTNTSDLSRPLSRTAGPPRSHCDTRSRCRSTGSRRRARPAPPRSPAPPANPPCRARPSACGRRGADPPTRSRTQEGTYAGGSERARLRQPQAAERLVSGACDGDGSDSVGRLRSNDNRPITTTPPTTMAAAVQKAA